MKNKEDVLKKVSRTAADKASRVLSKLVDKEINIEVFKAEVKKVYKLDPIIGPEEVVAGIYLPVKGDINGASLLIFPKESAFEMSDLLLKRNSGTTRRLSELDKSALKEVGNIISGSYFSILANMLQIKIVEDVPIFSFDMFGAIVSEIITKFVQKADKALVIEVLFTSKSKKVKGYYLLLFELEQFDAILGSLKSLEDL